MTTPTDAERVAEMLDRSTAYPYELTTGGRECLLADVTALMAAVRADERERAARIAETAAASAEGFNDVARNFATNIADAIRRQEG